MSGSKEIKLVAEGIRASFTTYGARLVSLQVPDRDSVWREVNIGYDDVETYVNEKAPSYFGAVIGRYANRIKDGKFTVDDTQFHIERNEHDGQNTLHGGKTGYDAREWKVVSQTDTSVAFSVLDEGFENFPGTVLALATYTVTKGKLTTVLTAHALDKATPILLTTHSYFNLGSTQSKSVLDDTLCLPNATRYIAVDDISVPTGEIVDTKGGPLDYTSPHSLRDSLAAKDLCGKGGVGIDNCFVFPTPSDDAQVIWSNASTGIRMRVYTNQPAIQLYAGLGFDGSLVSHLGPVEQYGCLAIEPQGLIDGINHPEWGHNQVYSSTTAPHVNIAEYAFDTVA